MQSVIDWLATQFAAILAALNPVKLVNDFAGTLAGQLPAPSDAVASFFGSASLALNAFLNYISFLDYFINLPLYIAIVGFIGTFELGLLLPRTWRFIRSFLT